MPHVLAGTPLPPDAPQPALLLFLLLAAALLALPLGSLLSRMALCPPGKGDLCTEQRRHRAAGLLFSLVTLALLLRYGLSLEALCFVALSAILLPISLIDWHRQRIPHRLLLAGLACFLLFCALSAEDTLRQLLLGLRESSLLSLPLFLFVLLANRRLGRESMGRGDLLLFFICALFFDWPRNLFMLLLSCLIGLCFALRLTKEARGAPFPFAPSIAIACVCTMLFGSQLLSRYLSLFGL